MLNLSRAEFINMLVAASIHDLGCSKINKCVKFENKSGTKRYFEIRKVHNEIIELCLDNDPHILGGLNVNKADICRIIQNHRSKCDISKLNTVDAVVNVADTCAFIGNPDGFISVFKRAGSAGAERLIAQHGIKNIKNSDINNMVTTQIKHITDKYVNKPKAITGVMVLHSAGIMSNVQFESASRMICSISYMLSDKVDEKYARSIIRESINTYIKTYKSFVKHPYYYSNTMNRFAVYDRLSDIIRSSRIYNNSKDIENNIVKLYDQEKLASVLFTLTTVMEQIFEYYDTPYDSHGINHMLDVVATIFKLCDVNIIK